jgi:hypothetical protein
MGGAAGMARGGGNLSRLLRLSGLALGRQRQRRHGDHGVGAMRQALRLEPCPGQRRQMRTLSNPAWPELGGGLYGAVATVRLAFVGIPIGI